MTKLTPLYATASSYYDLKYGPDKAIDGVKETGGWLTAMNKCENAWLDIKLEQPAKIKAVEIYSGFIEAGVDRDDFYWHRRPEYILIQVGDVTTPFKLRDSKDLQVVPVSGPETDTVRIKIINTYKTTPHGNKVHDVVGFRHAELIG